MRSNEIRTRSDLATLVILSGLALYVFVFAYATQFRELSPLACVVNRIVGIHCPMCGLTRAMACVARLDFLAALRFNPLVLFVVPAVAINSLNLLFRVFGYPKNAVQLPAKVAFVQFVGFAAILMMLFAVRTVTWMMPELNPEGWLIPPNSFPGE